MSQLKAQMKLAMTTAMKARDAATVQTLRTAMSAVQKKEIDENKELSDEAAQKVLASYLKQLAEGMEQAKSLGRAELVSAAEAEIKLLKGFLPQAISADELQSVVKEIVQGLKAGGNFPDGAAGMGLVMKQVMARVGARADGKMVQAAVRMSLGL